MTNKFADFINYLILLSSEEQLLEINFMINEFNKSNRNSEKIANKYRVLKQLKTLKKEIKNTHVMNNK